MGKDILRRRLNIQAKNAASFYQGKGLSQFHPENVEWIPKLLKIILTGCGMLNRGYRNSMDYRVEYVETRFDVLPKAFDGLRILQIADPHFDGIPDGGKKLSSILSSLEFDLCVLTGDYRFLTFHEYTQPIKILSNIIRLLECEHGIFGILGNHDFVEMAPMMEQLGIRMLLNENFSLVKSGKTIHIAGVDDPHYHGCHDLRKALTGLPREDFTLLLSHSPEIIKQAEAAGADYYLCGHTHAGQICLPGGVPIITNAHCSRKYTKGSWSFGSMHGHTSRGTGSSGISVRFFCPPEITIHSLRSNN